MDVVPTDGNPFSVDINIVEFIFYLPYVGPIMVIDDYEERLVESCNLTNHGFKWNIRDQCMACDLAHR